MFKYLKAENQTTKHLKKIYSVYTGITAAGKMGYRG